MHESIYDNFPEQFLQATKENAKIGDPFKEESFAGAQVSKVQYDRILSYIEQGKWGGAKLLHGGARSGSKGCFIQATVFVDVRTITVQGMKKMAYLFEPMQNTK